LRLHILLAILLVVSLLTIGYVEPVTAKAYDKRVIVFMEKYSYVSFNVFYELMKSEGFDVTVKGVSEVPSDPSILERYDVIIWISGKSPPQIVLQRVKDGAGLLILSDSNKALVIAGVLSTEGGKHDTTSRLVDHLIMNGVRSVYYVGCALKLVSSEAYPLIIGNDEVWGFKNPILAVINTYGEGRIIAVGGKTEPVPSYTHAFDSLFEDDYINREDNALLAKNIIYWLAGLNVPEFTYDLPKLIELKDKLTLLETNITRLAQQLKIIEQSIKELNLTKEIEVLKHNTTVLNQQLKNIDQKIENLALIDDLRLHLSNLTKEFQVISDDVRLLKHNVADISQQLKDFEDYVKELNNSNKREITALAVQIRDIKPYTYISIFAVIIAITALAITLLKRK